MFAHSCIPLRTKPTRVTSTTVSLIDNIFTKFIFDASLELKKGIIKKDVSTIFLYLFPYVLHQKFIKNIKRLLFIKE